MSVDLTQSTRLKNQEVTKNPNIVVRFEGYDKLFGAVIIRKFLRYGDDVNYGDEGLFYGGTIDVADQLDALSLGGGTTTTITQNVDIAKGRGNSIQSMTLSLVDFNNEITELISPGVVLDELLGRSTKVYYGYADLAWPEDYFVLFRGNVESISSGTNGNILIDLSHPDYKKRTNIFRERQTELDANLGAAATTVSVASTEGFFDYVTGPDGTEDAQIEYYLVINNEAIKYTGISGNTFTGCSRGQLGTTAADHESEDEVRSLVVLTGNYIDMALKLMLSGRDGPFVESLAIESVGTVLSEVVENVIFLKNTFMVRDYNLREGDFCTITGSAVGANNVTLSEILDIEETGQGTVITLDDSLTAETTTTGVAAFRSQYDVWGEGRGMSMRPDEVDIEQHLFIKDTFFIDFNYQIYIKESVEKGTDLLEQKMYNPAGCFSLVRQARASLGVHAPPLPTQRIPILNSNNVKNPSTLRINRTLSSNFYNGIVYRIDESPIEDRFLKTVAFVDGDSATRFGKEVPNTYLTIEASGLRTDSGGETLAERATLRRLKTYRFGAESIKDVSLTLEGGLEIEAGDVVLLQLDTLNFTDIRSGTRSGEPRLFRVEKKSFNIKTGETKVELVDTNFDKDVRYALISPASKVKSQQNSNSLNIKPSYFLDNFGANEFLKWQDYIGATLQIRNADYSLVQVNVLESISGNTLGFADDFSIAISEDMIIEFANYNNLSTNFDDIVKLSFASLSDNENDFSDGKVFYSLI